MDKLYPTQQRVVVFLMRVTLIQILISTFSMVVVLANDTMGQEILEKRITLNVNDTRFQDVLTAIGAQAKVKFAYSPELIDQYQKVTLHVEGARLADVLNRILPADISFKVVGKQIVLAPRPPVTTGGTATLVPDATREEAVAAFKVSGKVTDAGGVSLPGVNVLVKGTTLGTSTDADGGYTLEVASGDATLVFSFIGYATQEVQINNRTAIDVVLVEDLTTLTEVVVIGYGTQEKKEVTNAVAQVSGVTVLESKSATVSNALSGRVPGLIINQRNSRPGGDGATYYIRGMSTFRDASALVVVDGVANRDGLDRLDPNDIESITVLKDASAAIYGAQAANGVILVTTKRGSSDKPKVSYSYNHGFVSPVRLMKMSDAATYARGLNDLADQQTAPRPYSDATIQQYENGTLRGTNWFDEVYRNYFNQSRHSLTLSGGNETVKYFLSGGKLAQGSLLTNDDISKYDQYNFRSNVDVKVNKRLSLGLDIAGRRQNTNYTYIDQNTLYAAAVLSSPLIPATVEGYPGRGRSNNNPLAIVASPAYDKTRFNLFNGTFRYRYEIPKVEGLFVDGFAALDYWQSNRKQFQWPHSVYDYQGGILTRIQNNTATSLTQTNEQNNSITLNAKLNYQKTVGLHDIGAFIAVERNETRYDFLRAARNGFVSDQVDELFAGASSGQTNNGNAAETARLNYFGRLSYTYNGRYIAQFQFRQDGSYRFADGKQWGFFPGASLGWVLSEENFMKGVSAITFLKLRTSYGLLGNDRINPFQYLNLYSFSSNTGYVIGGQNQNIINPSVTANPDVTWERKKTFDVGVEGSLFNGKLSFEFDYFRMRTSEILSKRSITVPGYTGLNPSNLPDENIGIVDNNGIDGQVNYKGRLNNDLTFNVGVNATYARNTLVYFDEVDNLESYQNAEGKPIGALLLYEAIGIYRTQEDLDNYPGLNGTKRLGDPIYKDMNGDGLINSDDRVRSDLSSTPQIQYGVVFGAQYKGFDLSGNFMGQARAIVQFDYVFGEGNNTPAYWVKNAWSPSNPEGSLPRLGRGKPNQNEGSNFNTRSVAFLRLKNIELGYTLPKSLVSRVGIASVRVYVNAYNILTFDKLKKDGLTDPEEINPQGWQFPQTKSVNMGLSVNF